MQTFGVLKELMKYHNHTYGLLMGGANRQAEAQKLSKGTRRSCMTVHDMHFRVLVYVNYPHFRRCEYHRRDSWSSTGPPAEYPRFSVQEFAMFGDR